MPTILGLTNDAPSSTTTTTTTTTTEQQQPPKTEKMGKERLDTISKRNHHAAREVETLLWRALCDSPDAAKEYMADDCIMINPLFSGSYRPMSKDTDPSIDKILDGAEPWQSYKFHGEPMVVEIDLMAVALVYKITLFKSGRKGTKEVVATVSSSWRQTAGADWMLCAQHVAYADDEDDEEE